jgi:arsenate reductase-like glutaredoxin family protein
MKIKLYGAARCHKTQHYQEFFNARNLTFEFLDVEESEKNAEELRSLYTDRKLNFPTITLDNKKLRNPSDEELSKWIQKLQ